MNIKIKELFRQLFRKKQSVNSIVLFGNLVELPNRKEITDLQMLNKLDSYKREYLHILSQRKALISKDLEDDFRHEITRNTDLLLKSMQENKMEELYFIDVNKEEVEQLRRQVSLCKLNTYYETTKQLEEEMILRSVALTEIKNEAFFLSSLKENAIQEELNHLAAAIVMTRSQRKGIILEVSSYIPLVDEVDTTSMKNKKLDLLRKIIPAYFPNLKNIGEDIKEIAALENRLEVYFYEQKKEVLLRELEDLMAHDLKKAERMLWTMAIYGKDIVTEKELNWFYQRWFEKWSNGLFYNLDYDLTRSTWDFSCYSTSYRMDGLRLADFDIKNLSEVQKHFSIKIVEEKVEELLKGNLYAYQGVLDPRIAATSISRFLKGQNKTFDSTEILLNRDKLQFILSFEKKGRLEAYFYWHFYQDSSDYSVTNYCSIDMQTSFLKLIDPPSLEALYFLEYVNRNGKSNFYQENHYLYPIYSMLREDKKDLFAFPKDVVSIKHLYFASSSAKKWVQNMRNLVQGKTLMIPPYMAISNEIFDHLQFDSISFYGDNTIAYAFNHCQIGKLCFHALPHMDHSFEDTKIGELSFPTIYPVALRDKTDFKFISILSQFYQLNWIQEKDGFARYQVTPSFESLTLGLDSYMIRIDKKDLIGTITSRYFNLDEERKDLSPKEQEEEERLREACVTYIVGNFLKSKENPKEKPNVKVKQK